jgi:hypothetical protein
MQETVRHGGDIILVDSGINGPRACVFARITGKDARAERTPGGMVACAKRAKPT